MAVYVSPEAMEERTLMVIRKYNVLYMEQLLHFFEGEEKADLQKSSYRSSCLQ